MIESIGPVKVMRIMNGSTPKRSQKLRPRGRFYRSQVKVHSERIAPWNGVFRSVSGGDGGR